MAWWDFFKVFTYAFTDDPLSKQAKQRKPSAGISVLGGTGMQGQSGNDMGGSVRLQTNDFIDFQSVLSRSHRCKEYERLRNMPEIETAMTVFADETCFAGETKVATPHGMRTIQDLAETEQGKFLVYCYDFRKRDYTFGWAHSARKTKKAQTIEVILDAGYTFRCTPDHRILMRDGSWKEAGKLAVEDKIMPFYRIPARQDLTEQKQHQFPRIWTHSKGWIHERQFTNEWTTGEHDESLEKINTYCRMIAGGLTARQTAKATGTDPCSLHYYVEEKGWSNKELKWLGKKKDHRRVIGVVPGKEEDVYDITVEEHHNFATEWGIAHNCQNDDNNRVFTINVKNQAVKSELEYLMFHKKMLNFDQKTVFSMAKNLFIMGDFFYEILIDLDNPKAGIGGLMPLPTENMYRLETNKCRLVEFQQSDNGPDIQNLVKYDISTATDAELEQSKAIRFRPEQIIHIKIGDDRKTFYPYGVSLLEAARSPAYQLRLMEDAMVVYRLVRAPERLVFYVDTMQLSSAKSEALIDRMKDQLNKNKTPMRGQPNGSSTIDEKWHAPAANENYWIPVKQNSATRVEPLPGASNLGEIDDTVYFRNKLFMALNFPRNYFNNEDTQSTKVSLSSQNCQFARLIERLQSHIEDAFWEICDRHLRLLGYPEEVYEDLMIKMTPPSDWRELTRAEVMMNRFNNAVSLKGSMLMSDYDIYLDILKQPEEKTKAMLARLKIQKLDELKMQIVAQNPTVIGVGLPKPQEMEMGTDAGGPNPMISPDQNPMNSIEQPPPQGMRKYMDGDEEAPQSQNDPVLPVPSDEEIRKYDLDIKDFEKEMDEEEIDLSE